MIGLMGRSPTGARKRGQSSDLVSDLLKLVVGAALLGAVVFVTVAGLNSARSAADRGRLSDRVGLARTVAQPADAWLSELRDSAIAVASGATPSGDVLRVDSSGSFVGLSGRYVHLSGAAQSHPCPLGAGLREVVDAAEQQSGSVAFVMNPPGFCEPVIAAAAPAAGGVAVVTKDLGPFLKVVPGTSRLGSGIHALVIEPAGTVLSPDGPLTTVQPYLRPFAAQAAAGKSVALRQTTGDPGRPKVVDAGAPIAGGWAVVVEQDAAAFGVATINPFSARTIAVVALLFAIILSLQAISDWRRRATARHRDAHTAAFLAVLSHELRTPLTVIKGFIDTLAGRWDALTDEQRHELVDRLPQQSRRLNKIVDRLNLAAKLQAGVSPKMTLAPVEVAHELERVAESYTAAAPLHEFVVDASRDVIARADEKVLDQILDQLVDNAV